MQTFDLSVTDKAGRVLGTLPPANLPYGSFNQGDAFDFNGKRYGIDLVAHSIVGHGPDQLCRTLLVLGPFTPHLAPDSHSFPTVASGSGTGGGWVVGNG